MSALQRSTRALTQLAHSSTTASSSTSHLAHLRPLNSACFPRPNLLSRQYTRSSHPSLLIGPAQRHNPRRWNSSTSESAPGISPPEPGTTSQRIGQIQPRLQMTFTCTANDCGHRSTHEFAKKSYEKGLVLIQCPECKARHLIADHIGWFKESTEDGTLKTVEDLLRAKGEKIRKGKVNMDGDIEFSDE